MTSSIMQIFLFPSLKRGALSHPNVIWHFIYVQQISRTVKKKKSNFSSETAHYSEQTEHFVMHYLRYSRKRRIIHHLYETR
jgi:hypothetical protein